MPIFAKAPTFLWSANADGLAIRYAKEREYTKATQGRGDTAAQLGWIRMQMLAESGQAQVHEVDSGIFIQAADAVRLDAETRDGFELPPPWPGGMRLQTEAVPHSPNFAARLGLVDPGIAVRWDWKLRGPLLEVGQDSYLPAAEQYAALRAFETWRNEGVRDEAANLSMLASLREAHDAGCHIYLEAYKEMRVVNANEIVINVREDGEGGLILRPLPEGNFPNISADDIEQRFGHADGSEPRAVFRVGKTIVLLDEQQTAQARAIIKQKRIKPEDRDAFLKAPQEWLREHHLLSDQARFSNRVTGIDYWREGYTGVDWDAGMGEILDKPQPQPTQAPPDPGLPPGDPPPVDPEPVRLNKLVPVSLKNDEKLEYGVAFPGLDKESAQIDFSKFAREPKEHQKKAVIWLLRHARRALQRRITGLGAGALLADDMGLGKTFSTLMFVHEWLDLLRTELGKEPPAVLIIAPLSLQENWKKEIESSYRDPKVVFSRELYASPGHNHFDLVRSHPSNRDIAVPGQVNEYGLVFGEVPPGMEEKRLDMPGSCVLTTYQTLRDYRFSFAKAEWSTVIFDEAQNIKNPNAMQSIAAKALKSLFRLALTGTPVENHLGDFWSILDTAEPGPLGSFVEFREQWIHKMKREPENMTAIGKNLQAHVGELMMRRSKEDKDIGLDLPGKSGHHDAILVKMSEEQADAYESIISGSQPEGEQIEGSDNRNRFLAALWDIRRVSLHPALMGDGTIPNAHDKKESHLILSRSAKLKWLLTTLDEIKAAGEKALIFCIQKKLQVALSHHLSLIYGITVPVVNGDTDAGDEKEPETRLGLIKQFSEREGFGVCILSPIAAGAGLNIVAANHVIHLERHWNPAKEDQATDRAYRMGQTKPVKVYLPVTQHPNPERRAFDEVLHELIERKRELQGAMGLVPPQSVSKKDIFTKVFTPAANDTPQEPLGIASALNLSWRLFEALIAALYSRDAERVILTPGGSDHGCDVVVLGWGEQRANLLIQCKQTSSNKLDSEVAVREVEGARPFYENALGVSFGSRVLHTTARLCSRRTKRAAELCRVTVNERDWLAEALRQTPVTMAEVFAQDIRREKLA